MHNAVQAASLLLCECPDALHGHRTTAVTGVQQLLHWYGGDGGAHNILQGPSTRVAWLSHYTWHCPPASGQPLCPIGKSRHARQSKKLCAYLPGFVDFHTHMLPVIKASTLQPAAIDKPGTVGSCAIAEGNTPRNQHQRDGWCHNSTAESMHVYASELHKFFLKELCRL